MEIRIKRIYEPVDQGDGYRVLVDRLWPRGIKKEAAAIDIWTKELAPSHELRRWFDHDPDKFEEFAKRYQRELAKQDDSVRELFEKAKGPAMTLLYSARDHQHNQAVVLKAWLLGRIAV